MRETLTAQSFGRNVTESVSITRKTSQPRLAVGARLRYQSLVAIKARPCPVDALVVANGNGRAMRNEETPMPQTQSVAPIFRQRVLLPSVTLPGIHGVFR